MERPAKSFLESFLSEEPKKVPAIATVQRVHCPTCGAPAERYHLKEDGIMRTQCPRCDYLMSIYVETGRVIEAYAPSFSPAALAASPAMG